MPWPLKHCGEFCLGIFFKYVSRIKLPAFLRPQLQYSPNCDIDQLGCESKKPLLKNIFWKLNGVPLAQLQHWKNDQFSVIRFLNAFFQLVSMQCIWMIAKKGKDELFHVSRQALELQANLLMLITVNSLPHKPAREYTSVQISDVKHAGAGGGD